MNMGKGEGCAYRGRVLCELSTDFNVKTDDGDDENDDNDDEDTPKAAAAIPDLSEETDDQEPQLASLQKYYAYRSQFKLIVAILNAGMMPKKYENLHFEVSIGVFGYNWKSTSHTEYNYTNFDGVKYHYATWTKKKPVLVLSSMWEDICFRLQTMNFILKLMQKLQGDVDYINMLISKKESTNDEIAAEIIETLDAVVKNTQIPLLNPREYKTANQLDIRLHSKRLRTFFKLHYQAKDLMETCCDVDIAMVALQDMVHELKAISFEPQMSIPDVIIWMFNKDQRIAYARIPANEFLCSSDRDEFSGQRCGIPQVINLKYPDDGKGKGKDKDKTACQLNLIAWFGKENNVWQNTLDNYGKITVMSTTYEFEKKNAISLSGSWKPVMFADQFGNELLPKETFSEPPGWKWNKSWSLNLDRTLVQTSFVQEIQYKEYYEYQGRDGPVGSEWLFCKMMTPKYEEILHLDVHFPIVDEEMEWVDAEWTVHTDYDCDADGWEYSPDTIGHLSVKTKWYSEEKQSRATRRRRMVRGIRKIHQLSADEQSNLDDGWEYAGDQKGPYCTGTDSSERFRRRKWERELEVVDGGVNDLPKISILYLNSRGTTSDKVRDVATLDEQTSPITPPKTTAETGDGGNETEEEDQLNSNSSTNVAVSPLSECVLPNIYIYNKDPIKLQLRAYIYEGRNLPLTDVYSSDPVAIVSCMNACRRTQVLRKSVFPCWDVTLIMDFDFYGCRDHLAEFKPDVTVEVFDYDPDALAFGGKHEEESSTSPAKGHLTLLGRCSAQPTFHNDLDQLKLQWYDLYNGDKSQGHILAAFELYTKDEEVRLPTPATRPDNNFYSIPPTIRPVLCRTMIEFVCWGVRNMADFKLMSVNKPCVLLQIGSATLQTSHIDNCKSHPNFKDPLYCIEADLPRDRSFFPPIKIRVKDQRSFGSCPTVGILTIADPFMYRVNWPGSAPSPGRVVLQYDPPDDPAGEGAVHSESLETAADTLAGSNPFDDKKEDKTQEAQENSSLLKSDSSQAAGDTTKKSSEKTSEKADEVDGKSKEDKENDLKKKKDRREIFKNFLFKSSHLLKTVKSWKEKKPLTLENEIDWWTKFYASMSAEDEFSQKYIEDGHDLMKVYENELEDQEAYGHFYDFLETHRLMLGTGGGKKDADDDDEYVGELKGTFRIYEIPEDEQDKKEKKLHFHNIPATSTVDLIVRVYVVRAFDLAPKDSNGLSDPYIKIKCGKSRINDRKNYIPNTLNPTFGRMFELDASIPQDKDLIISVKDYDLIGSDDPIGETVIDLENRYYSKYRAWCALPVSYCTEGPSQWRDQMTPKQWLVQRAEENKWELPIWNGNTCVIFNNKTYHLEEFEQDMKENPHWGSADERLALHILRTSPFVEHHVETRPLFEETMPGIEQGRVQLWVDIFPKEMGPPEKPIVIAPRKPSKYFVRVVIWNVEEIPFTDTNFSGTQMTDIYVKGWINGQDHKKQKTDVHYRSLDGTGMFNWRFVFPIDYIPQEKVIEVRRKEHFWSKDKTSRKFSPALNIQTWDNDLFGSNEFISEITVNLTKMPVPCKWAKTCEIENVPDNNGNCEMEIVNLFEKKHVQGWYPLVKTQDGEKIQAGKLEVSIEICSENDHEERLCAKGRKEPNAFPKLQKPNRPATSFAWFSSPFKSLQYIIWKRYKWIIIGLLLTLLLTAMVVIVVLTVPKAVIMKYI